jgi:hypothetical protein
MLLERERNLLIGTTVRSNRSEGTKIPPYGFRLDVTWSLLRLSFCVRPSVSSSVRKAFFGQPDLAC